LANTANPTDFMTWEKIGDPANPALDLTRDTSASTPTTGPDGTSPAYRLEVKNLIPNGDFEDAALTPPGSTSVPTYWKAVGYQNSAAQPPTIAFGPTPSPTGSTVGIDHIAMGWKAGANGDQLQVELETAATQNGTVPTAWTTGYYRFRADFIEVATDKSSVPLFLYTAGETQVTDVSLVENGGDWTVLTKTSSGTPDNTSVFSVSRKLLVKGNSTSDPAVLAFGPSSNVGGVYSAVIDNVRMVPDDYRTLWAAASLPSLNSGTLTLLPGSKVGMYTFTVQVRDDPTASTASNPRSSLNRFEPNGLTIQLQAYTKSGLQTLNLFTPRPTGGWTTWTTVQFQLGFDFVDADSDLPSGTPALKILLAPADLSQVGTADAGSLLVSQPVLTFNP
jgi:hypothetical protein